MAKTNFEKVLQFHQTYNQPIGTIPNPNNLSVQRENLRNGFIIEEFCELLDAQGYNPAGIHLIQAAWKVASILDRVRAPDIVEIADALADIEYFNHGTAVEYGINLDSVFSEVHSSNMSKLGEDGKPVYREDGKVLKGPNYFKPDIEMVLVTQDPIS
ncbi:phosphoribosyl-ATP diphosphatase [Caulobacter phage Cr30]|uniref:nucleotide pyrophosphohydrolase n=1 Tax=Caulobacter phage Cr30 TaxID=1357714 RepID=UPI0004A9BA45|nr:nucleotide pyrophosphohydrolase [Caulobacter phage Cr30]AGS81018.1 phosphoribosyl-ATP diphosphatase [Caulobacter phage Cr30]